MPDLPISGLTEDTTPATTDTIALRRASANFRATMAQLLGAFFGANQIIKADSALTVTGLTVAEDRILGRIAGGVIDDLTPTQVRTIINVADGATANPNAVEATSTFGTDNRILRADSTARLAQAGADATLDDSGNLVTAGYLRGDWLVETTASTSITWSDSYTGKLIICTAATTVTITCGNAVTANTHTTWLQAGNGQLQFAVSGSVTFLKLSGYNANCVGAGGFVVSVVTTAAAALGTSLGGDLEPV